ncbi:nucleoside triphosphate pyrophosphohydrolase [Dyella marensis]|uniref:nucleoside triphosphate pyrophosphohydrolase n=1 Tax=Dyella TaxID=231454 RepID=UPI001160B46A|nr:MULTISPECIES: nucleoside triphosphate pyrophosphohydrolase [Dyella]
MDFLLPNAEGVKPSSLVSKALRPNFDPANLQCFSVANAEHFEKYGKLKNARIYVELGYDMPSFFVMNRPEIIDAILQDKVVPEALRRDLKTLCAFPFVIRTDATGLAGHNKQMLPRSDELRSSDAAVSWLLKSFRTVMLELEGARDITLVGHHFLPATASAWAQAQPDERRVRIESLWGIPEGTYYFAHDVYDIDTGVAKLEQGGMEGCREMSVRERFKGRFIAPNDSGDWIVQQTDETSDWARSVRKKTWLQEIAWTTRRIAVREGKPVVVMWFVDIPQMQSRHEVMPWYHEGWEPVAGGYKKAAQRKKVRSAEFKEISNRESWNKLKEDVAHDIRIERVFINPADSEIVRDRQFVKELADHAQQHGYVVELGGGLLSHAFYMLSKAGCAVECVDLFGVQEENIEFNKLVRDLIPRGIQERGEQVEIVRVTGDALIESLKRKIVEEVYEVVDAKSAGPIVEEIADVEEVIDGLLKALGIDRTELLNVQTKKRHRRGGFDQGIMLVRTSLATPVVDSPPLDGASPDLRSISRPEDLPAAEQDFHVDRRVDVSGIPERQLTLTLPAQANSYASGTHRFSLENQDGTPHDLVFSAQVERYGAQLKLKVKLTNAAVQLGLPFDEPESK